MNFKYIMKNYSEKAMTRLFNSVPLKYHSSVLLRPFFHALLKNYWTKQVNDPHSPNNYKKYYRDIYAEFNILCKAIEQRLKRRPLSFFEVGCNVGSNLMAIAKVYNFDKNIYYSGCDINKYAIENAKKSNYGGKADFHCVDLTKEVYLKDIADSSFDLIFSRDVFMFIEPDRLKRKIIGELLRISKDCLLLMEPYRGEDEVAYINAHLVYYEDMYKYLPKDKITVDSLDGFGRQVFVICKE